MVSIFTMDAAVTKSWSLALRRVRQQFTPYRKWCACGKPAAITEITSFTCGEVPLPAVAFSFCSKQEEKVLFFLLFFGFVMSLLFTGPSFAEFSVVEALAYPLTVAEILQMSVVYIDGREWKPVLATDFAVN